MNIYRHNSPANHTARLRASAWRAYRDGFSLAVAVMVFLAATFAAAAESVERVWHRPGVQGPSPRVQHAMAYDAARERVVMFGGVESESGSFAGGTWEWDGVRWRLAATDGPPARAGHAMAYDTARERVVLFGGRGGATLALLNDTWEWDGQQWREVFFPGPPPARQGHAMAYDSERSRMILFGGNNGEHRGDTWERIGAQWFPVHAEGPGPRTGAAMVYDTARGRMVLYGGYDGSWRHDTWEWDGSTWEFATHLTPRARTNHSMIYDTEAERTVLFGGVSHSRLPLTWHWDGAQWHRATGTFQPPVRSSHAMAWDAARGETVLFGGQDRTGILADTWLHGQPAGIAFDFSESEQGWIFGNPPGFSEVQGSYRPAMQSLSHIPSDNQNAFAFWGSPIIGVNDPLEEDAPFISGGTGDGQLYLAEYLAASDGDPARVPDMRTRTSSADFHRSDVISFISGAWGDVSPAEPPRVYRHFFLLPGCANGLGLHWDVLNVGGLNDAGVELELLYVSAVATEESLYGSRVPVVQQSFQGGDRLGFTPRTGAPIPPPAEFEADERGLLIRGAEPNAKTDARNKFLSSQIFGFWGRETNIPVKGGALYRFEWTVETDGVKTASDRTRVPTFRMRVNDSSLQTSYYVNIDSRDTGSRIPMDGQPETYIGYFETPPEIDGGTWILSFDYLYTEQSGADPTIALIFKKVSIDVLSPTTN